VPWVGAIPYGQHMPGKGSIVYCSLLTSSCKCIWHVQDFASHAVKSRDSRAMSHDYAQSR